jgi:hypothetical protein
MIKKLGYTFCFILLVQQMVLLSSCANIVPPTGGPRDSLPPRLVMAIPKDSATNVTGNKINLTFNEFVEIQSAQEQVIVSPYPKNAPVIDYKFRNVTVKLRDTLEPNTTYSINFGDAIKDVNEGNIVKGFTYVFSTGSVIDSSTFSGKVQIAQTGKIDTTLIVVLHRNGDDSAVAKERPRYITRLDGKGNFIFRNLPTGTFYAYVVPNEYSKKYDDTTKLFAFLDQPVNVNASTKAVTFYAFALEDKKPAAATATSKSNEPKNAEKKIIISSNLDNNRQDLLGDLVLTFNRPLKKFDSAGFQLTDTNFVGVGKPQFQLDSTNTKLTLKYPWQQDKPLRLVIQNDAVTDTTGLILPKKDTLEFVTKREADYGSVRLRFANLDTAAHPVLLLLKEDRIVEASPITQRDWTRKLFLPGEYDIRILYDTNKNGKWDTGYFFGKHLQPEIVSDLKLKLVVRANWDNEKDINLSMQR